MFLTRTSPRTLSGRWRHAIGLRLRLLGLAALCGMMLPWFIFLLPRDGITSWVAALVLPWQWLYVAAGLLTTLVLATLSHHRADRWLPMATVIAAALVLITGYPDEHASPDAGQSVLTVISANVHFENADPGPLHTWASREHADLLLLHEASPAYRAALSEMGWTMLLDCSADSPFGFVAASARPLAGFEVLDGCDAGAPQLVMFRLNATGHTRWLALHTMPPVTSDDSATLNGLIEGLATRVPDDDPTVVLGDLNTTPWSPVLWRDRDWRRLSGPWPTWKHLLPLDHVLVRGSLAPATVSLGGYLGSDHRALLMRIATRTTHDTASRDRRRTTRVAQVSSREPLDTRFASSPARPGR